MAALLERGIPCQTCWAAMGGELTIRYFDDSDFKSEVAYTGLGFAFASVGWAAAGRAIGRTESERTPCAP